MRKREIFVKRHELLVIVDSKMRAKRMVVRKSVSERGSKKGVYGHVICVCVSEGGIARFFRTFGGCQTKLA